MLHILRICCTIIRRLPLVSLPKLMIPVASAKTAGSLVSACLEQVSNPWKTAGNISSFARFLRNSGNYITNVYLSWGWLFLGFLCRFVLYANN
jgi:hypothetical protein